MKDLTAVVINSAFENIEKLADRIYFEAEREGYHNLTQETKQGIQISIFIFKNLKNKDFIETLVRGYEYLNESDIYFGKVKKIEEYNAIEYTGKPIRIRVTLDNEASYDIPQIAKEHLKIIL